MLTFVPYNFINNVKLGLIVGSDKFVCFPVVQYCGYYILGMYFQKKLIRFDIKYLILSTLCTFIFYGYIFIYKELPSRFPPSVYWIIGGMGFIYLYYLISCFLAKKISNDNRIYFIGENTLYFLLVSNLILFILRGIFNFKFRFIINILLSILIISLCYILIYISKFKNYR